MYLRLLGSLLAVSLATVTTVATASSPAAQGALIDALRALQAIDSRVAGIGHRLALANRPLCAIQEPLPGFLVHALAQYAPAARPAARAAFGLAERPAVSVVVPDSVAARAGVAVGDRMVRIGGVPVAAPKIQNHAEYAGVEAVENQIEAALAAGPVDLEIDRSGETRIVRLETELGCVSRVQVVPSGRLNASADGEYAQLTTRIVALAQSDDELAMIVAHEMAHNILEHRRRLKTQGVAPGLLRGFGRSGARVKATEIEADYLAHYLVARAGFRVAAAPDLYRRLSRASGDRLFGGMTHLAGGRRVRYSDLVVAEIAAKAALGAPLLPAAAAPPPPR